MKRRRFLHATVTGLAATMSGDAVGADDATSATTPRVTRNGAWAGKVGIVTAVLSRFMSSAPAPGRFTLLELPRVLRDELDLTIIDYNSVSFPHFDPEMLEKLRAAADDAGCIATNLKLNQKVDMGSADEEVRKQALDVYFRSVDAAALLGLAWVRPLPQPQNDHPGFLVDSYRRLADYAAGKGIAVLVENFGWMMDDANSVNQLLTDIDRPGQVAAGIDTGNWSSNEVRYPGLEKSMPLAVTCDFKAKKMNENGDHPDYDLRRCFDIAWQSGFRGPWAIEHGHADRRRAFREIGIVRDSLREWMKDAG